MSGLGNRGLRMGVSKSFLDSTRRVVESWMFAKRGIVRLSASGGLNGLRFPMVGAGVESGCVVVELALRLPRSGRVGSHRVN